MQVEQIRALRGPNLWTHHTAIQCIVRCSEEESDIRSVSGFERKLRRLFPEIGALQAPGPESAIPLAKVLELAALGLQAQAGCPVTFSSFKGTREPRRFQVVLEYTEEDVGRLALDLAQRLCHAAWHDQSFDLTTALGQLRELDEDVRLGPSTGSIVYAAVRRSIPFSRMTEGSMVRLGWGSKQRRIQAAEIDVTSAISESIARDKQLTKKLISAVGVPVPEGREVVDEDDAYGAALEIGFPVVVKPKDGNQGKGVTVNITEPEQVRKAFHAARDFRDKILVERYIPGHDFRILVVGDKMIAAARRDPPTVVGDGHQTIAKLVEQVNRDPRRGDGHATSLTKIRFDDIAKDCLSTQGLSADSVPEKGQRVRLRNNANLSTGGSATDMTEDVHPEVAARAVAAAQMVGLDVCGVDIVAESILRPLEEQGGGVVEVNAAPGLRMHLTPSFGKGRPVGEAIIASMFSREQNGRIPVVAVTGTNGKTTTVRLITQVLRRSGMCVGMTNTDGVYVDDYCVDTGDCSGPRSARSVLHHPDVDAAVLETARGGILREGLAFDRCDVAVVTNLGQGDHLGLNDIHTVTELAAVKSVIVQNLAPTGTAVLNATDPVVAAMARKCAASVIFFALDKNHPVMVAHRAQKHGVVYREDGYLVAFKEKIIHRFDLRDIPLTQAGALGFQIENVMACIASAWALGTQWNVIEQALKSFSGNHHNALGRFNVFEHRGATVIADYGHNADAMVALVQAVDAIPASRRSVVISGAGDRRDEDIIRQTQVLGDAFDEVVMFEDQCQRGRPNGEVIALLRKGLEKARRTKEISEIYGEFLAIDAALEKLREGELCLVLVDQVPEAIAHIKQRLATSLN
jgi:cyanophycin synthetase